MPIKLNRRRTSGNRVEAHGVRGEPRMTSLAFPPDYARTGLFYVTYTDYRNALVLAEYRRSADRQVADAVSGRTILRMPQPTPAHHGGLLAFGPDGYLYVATGDGGPAGDPAGAAQDTNLLRGKILRSTGWCRAARKSLERRPQTRV